MPFFIHLPEEAIPLEISVFLPLQSIKFFAFLQPVESDFLKLQFRGGHHSTVGGMTNGSGWEDRFFSLCHKMIVQIQALQKGRFFWSFSFKEKDGK